MFSCQFCKIFKNTFFTEHLAWLLLHWVLNIGKYLKSYGGVIETFIMFLEILHSGVRKIGSSLSEMYNHASIMSNEGNSYLYQFQRQAYVSWYPSLSKFESRTSHLDQTFNPFLVNVPSLYPLKTLENQRFYGVFMGYKLGTLARNGLMVVNKSNFWYILLKCEKCYIWHFFQGV